MRFAVGGVVQVGPSGQAAPTRPSARDWLIGGAVFAALAIPLLLTQIHRSPLPIDLTIYREAGQVALHHQDPYSASFASDLPKPLPFTYPPFAALVLLPTALVPKPVLLIGWTALCVGALVAMAWVGVRPVLAERGWRHPAAFGLAAGILLWTVPVSQTLWYGQINLFLGAACLLDCCRASRHRGVLVGVATAIKLTPGIFIAYFALTRQWAAAARAAVVAAACTLIGVVVHPGPSREYWLRLVFDTRRPGNPAYFSNQSVYGALYRLHITWLWIPLAGALGIAGLWRAVRAHAEGAEIAAVALVGFTAIVLSPISWDHHAVWVVPATGALLAWATNPGRKAAAAAVVALFLMPLAAWGVRLHDAGFTPDWVTIALRNSYAVLFAGLLLLLPVAARPDATGSGIPAWR